MSEENSVYVVSETAVLRELVEEVRGLRSDLRGLLHEWHKDHNEPIKIVIEGCKLAEGMK